MLSAKNGHSRSFYIPHGSVINKKNAYSVIFCSFATFRRLYVQNRAAESAAYSFLHIFAMSKTLFSK